MIEAQSKVLSNGRVEIPFEIRTALGIEEGDKILFVVDEGKEAKIQVLKSSSVLDLYGSVKPNKPFLRDFSEIRADMHEERAKRLEKKREE